MMGPAENFMESFHSTCQKAPSLFVYLIFPPWFVAHSNSKCLFSHFFVSPFRKMLNVKRWRAQLLQRRTAAAERSRASPTLTSWRDAVRFLQRVHNFLEF